MGRCKSLFDALDLPPEATDLQDAYWNARRKWKSLDAAYHLVLADLLGRNDVRFPPPAEGES